MSLDDLEQALFEARWGDAEENGTDVIAKMFDLDPGIVDRVLWAASCLRNPRKYAQIVEGLDEGTTLPSDLKQAIEREAQRGVRRAWVRWAIQNDAPLMIPASVLLKGDDVRKICHGCPISLGCALNHFSTPKKCVRGGPPVEAIEQVRLDTGQKTWRLVHQDDGSSRCEPLKIQGDVVTVSCEHPKGTWTIDVGDIPVR